MANRKLDFGAITGVAPKNNVPGEIVSLPKKKASLPVTTKTQHDGPNEGKVVAKSTNVKGPEDRRKKKNFNIKSTNCLQITLLAKYMNCGPGHIVDMALDQFFSDPEVKEIIRKAIQVDRLEKELLEKSV